MKQKFKIIGLMVSVLASILIVSILSSDRVLSQTRSNADTLYVKDFGAIGNGKTNDTQAINNALLTAAQKGKPISFEPGKTYLATHIALNGSRENPYNKLEIYGEGATLKSIAEGKGNTLRFKFIDTLKINSLKVIGNKNAKIDGNGIKVSHAKWVELDRCSISNSKFSGLLLGWVHNAVIKNNTIFNNGDGSLPSDGITIHSLQKGKIINNRIYNNNPGAKHDGDGIHISQSQYNSRGYYNINQQDYILVAGNISYKHGRRGIKVQRSKVVVRNNLLFKNHTGILVARNEPINDIVVEDNVIVGTVVGVRTDGADKIRVLNLTIRKNIFLGKFRDARMEIQDSKQVSITNNIIPRGRNNKAPTDVLLHKNSAHAIGQNAGQRITQSETQLYRSQDFVDTEAKAFKVVNSDNYTLLKNDRLLLVEVEHSKVFVTPNQVNASGFVLFNNRNATVTVDLVVNSLEVTDEPPKTNNKRVTLIPNQAVVIKFVDGYFSIMD